MTEPRQFPKIVNVASVPQRSPFRYPGGKTWLVPYLRAWLKSLSFHPERFAEPFAGGAIISLTVGFEQLAHSVEMVELDEDVAAVWQIILGKDSNSLVTRIRDFDVTGENVKAELAKPTPTQLQKAFNTILKNRTFHGGILAHGSSMIKHGENGKGIKSRWYAETLCQRILAITEIQDRFTFTEGDGIPYLETRLENPLAVFFIDPPYTAGGNGKRAGRRLYKHSELNHDNLFDIVARIKGHFLMTYDNDPEVITMARNRGFDTEVVPMKNTHHAAMMELLISRNLSWARSLLYPTAERTLFDN